jgi:hypothetical protein
MDLFDQKERRNISFYLVGLALYSLGLEIFNGSLITLALDRFTSETFEHLGILVAVHQFAQFVGAIFIVRTLLLRFNEHRDPLSNIVTQRPSYLCLPSPLR